jgi:hypothetical protein
MAVTEPSIQQEIWQPVALAASTPSRTFQVAPFYVETEAATGIRPTLPPVWRI